MNMLNTPLEQTDADIFNIIEEETQRQEDHIELIASGVFQGSCRLSC